MLEDTLLVVFISICTALLSEGDACLSLEFMPCVMRTHMTTV